MPSRTPIPIAIATALLALPTVSTHAAGEQPTGIEIARKIQERPRATQASRDMQLELIREGREPRRRRLRSFWRVEPEVRRLALFAVAPPDVKHSALLVYEWDDGRDDDQWIYKVARKRAERIPLTRRGESFLGSEFTIEDLKREDTVEIAEFTWKTLGETTVGGRPGWLLEQVPASERLAKNLGFGRAVNHVDRETWLRRKIEFFDLEGKPLKTFEMTEAKQIDGFWTAVAIDARHRSGHRSNVRFTNVDYQTPLADEIFTVRALERERTP